MDNIEHFLKHSGIEKINKKKKRRNLKENMLPMSFRIEPLEDDVQSRTMPLPSFGDLADKDYDNEDPVMRAVVLSVSSAENPPTNPNTGQPYSNFHDLVNHFLEVVMGEERATLAEIGEILSSAFSEVGEITKDTNKDDALSKISYDYEKKVSEYEPPVFDEDDEDEEGMPYDMF